MFKVLDFCLWTRPWYLSLSLASLSASLAVGLQYDLVQFCLYCLQLNRRSVNFRLRTSGLFHRALMTSRLWSSRRRVRISTFRPHFVRTSLQFQADRPSFVFRTDHLPTRSPHQAPPPASSPANQRRSGPKGAPQIAGSARGPWRERPLPQNCRRCRPLSWQPLSRRPPPAARMSRASSWSPWRPYLWQQQVRTYCLWPVFTA